MASRYLASLSKEKYDGLVEKLKQIQNNICYICQNELDTSIQQVNVDHIIPLANKGKDSEENFALTHESCNKSKQDADLRIARMLSGLREIQEDVEKENRSASLKDVLVSYGGSKYPFKSKIENNTLKYSFSETGDNKFHFSPIFEDHISKERTCFIEVPISYLYHDELINPRGINSSISKLVKEFYKGNPQLHLSLARIDGDILKIFDGQHKAVAQILLGNKKLTLRVFINPNVDRLIETNTNAGSTLRQIAFDKSIMRQLNNMLYLERIKKYQDDHSLDADNFSFSEEQLVDYFKGENVNIKKLIIESIKSSVTYSQDNKLKDYIDFEGKAKELPISHSTFDKTFLSVFIDSKLILNEPINFKSEEGSNPRELEITQIINLLNIIAEEIYLGKFDPDVGVYRIEKRIIQKKDKEISDNHLIAYRISKEEVMYNWLVYVKKIIELYFDMTGKIYDDRRLFQLRFDEQLWTNIRNFVKNLKDLPLWRDRSMASTIFAGKNNYDYWKNIFESGKNPDGVQILARPLNFTEMAKNSV